LIFECSNSQINKFLSNLLGYLIGLLMANKRPANHWPFHHLILFTRIIGSNVMTIETKKDI